MPDTTIRLAKSTRDRLKEHGGKGESYDDLINRLLNQLEAD